jgi:hypothetical protein
MEKFNLEKIVESWRGSLRSMAGGGMNPDFSWRMVVLGSCITAIALSISAVLAYQWAANLADPVVANKTDHAISVKDIHDVITEYNAKESQFEEFLTTNPSAPVLDRSSGIDASTTVDTATDIPALASTTATTAQSTGSTTHP